MDESANARPGVFKVFWPAFLGWGTAAICLAVFRSHWYLEVAPTWFRGALEQVFGWIILFTPLLAIGVSVMYREAQGLVAVLLNLSTFLLYFLFMVP